ncbi:MAG: recombinase family protein [Frankiaceae bacterium]
MALGYARVSTAKQDLDRQIDGLTGVGIPRTRISVDRRPEQRPIVPICGRPSTTPTTTTSSPYALDRLGRNVRDTLNLIHDLAARGVGIRNLADPSGSTPAHPATRRLNSPS